MTIVDWVIIAIVVAGIVIAVFGWDRYRGNRRSAGQDGGFEPTDEVFLDPATGRRMRVWYNPRTGQREYRAN